MRKMIILTALSLSFIFAQQGTTFLSGFKLNSAYGSDADDVTSVPGFSIGVQTYLYSMAIAAMVSSMGWGTKYSNGTYSAESKYLLQCLYL